MKNAKTTNDTPRASLYDNTEHNHAQIDAIISVTRTEHIPLVFGNGEQTPGNIIDEMLREGEVSKISLNLNRDDF